MIYSTYIFGAHSAYITKGYEAIYGQNRIISTQRIVPRFIESRIDFKKPMNQIPQIMINPNLYDWEAGGLPVDWQIQINRINLNGFFYKITTNSQ